MEPQSNLPTVGDIERAARALAAQYAIDSSFVRVAVLSRILGLSAPTIYAAMKAGRFPIPHRKVGATPLVKLDDLAAWYCSQERTQTVNQPARKAAEANAVDNAARDRLIRSVMRELRVEDE